MENAKVIAAMKEFIDTYPDQIGWQEYTKDTVLNDLIYGIGVAIDHDKYSFAMGYRYFKKDLIKFLTNPDE